MAGEVVTNSATLEECMQLCVEDEDCIAIEYENLTSISKSCWHFTSPIGDTEAYDKTDIYVLTRCLGKKDEKHKCKQIDTVILVMERLKINSNNTISHNISIYGTG